MEYKNSALNVQDLDTKKGIVTGYFAEFNTIDSHKEITTKEAFTKTLQENRSRIKWLLDHDITQAIGTLSELYVDDYGLKYVGQLGTHWLGQDMIKRIESGLITEHSYGYAVIKAEQKDNVRHLKEVRLFEGSCLQAWGSNPNTPLVGIKSINDVESYTKRVKAICKYLKESNAPDDILSSIEIELCQLGDALKTAIINNEEVKEAIKKEQDSVILTQLGGIKSLLSR